MAFFSSDIYQPDALLAGNASLLMGRKVTIPAGHELARGALLGKIEASGEYVLSEAAATDGSEIPDLVLAESVDTTDGAAEALAYERGDFRGEGMILGTGHTVETVRESLREKGIFITSTLEF